MMRFACIASLLTLVTSYTDCGCSNSYSNCIQDIYNHCNYVWYQSPYYSLDVSCYDNYRESNFIKCLSDNGCFDPKAQYCNSWYCALYQYEPYTCCYNKVEAQCNQNRTICEENCNAGSTAPPLPTISYSNSYSNSYDTTAAYYDSSNSDSYSGSYDTTATYYDSSANSATSSYSYDTTAAYNDPYDTTAYYSTYSADPTNHPTQSPLYETTSYYNSYISTPSPDYAYSSSYVARTRYAKPYNKKYYDFIPSGWKRKRYVQQYNANCCGCTSCYKYYLDPKNKCYERGLIYNAKLYDNTCGLNVNCGECPNNNNRRYGGVPF